jgi:hypothetical protein
MLWTAPPPARECHEGGMLLRPLRLEGANALAADSHQQPALAHPARDPPAYPRRGRVS